MAAIYLCYRILTIQLGTILLTVGNKPTRYYWVLIQ